MKNDSHKEPKKISDAVIRRLPRYYRRLCDLEADGATRISSKVLGASLGVKASQIRQDLNSFGGFGQQGYGYSVPDLKTQLEQILAIDGEWKMVIVGAGNIGRALAEHREFSNVGFKLYGLFDRDEELVGTMVGGAEVYHVSQLSQFIVDNHIDIVALTVPASAAQGLLEVAARAGAGAVWNYAPIDVFSDKVVVENIHLTDSLMALSFRLNHFDKGEEEHEED